MRRVLLVTDRCLLPETDGSSRIYAAWLQALGRLGCHVSVVSFDHHGTRWTATGLAALDKFATRRHVAELYPSVVHAGASHIFKIGANWLTGSIAARSRLRSAELDRFLAGEDYDAVIVQKSDTAAMLGAGVLANLPGRKIVDLHDNMPRRMALLREAARRSLGQGGAARLAQLRREEIEAIFTRGDYQRHLADEIRLLRDFDQVLFAGPSEMAAYLAAGLPERLARAWRWGFDVEGAGAAANPRFDLGLIGGHNLFNVEAMRRLLHRILPLVEDRLQRKVSVLLGGGAARAFADEARRSAGLRLLPQIDDLAGFYRDVAVIVVPLSCGTGVSVKTMEAARSGKPIVSTSVGLRGLELRGGVDVEVADADDVIADRVASLLADPARRSAAGESARLRSEERHSLDVFTGDVARLLGMGG